MRPLILSLSELSFCLRYELSHARGFVMEHRSFRLEKDMPGKTWEPGEELALREAVNGDALSAREIAERRIEQLADRSVNAIQQKGTRLKLFGDGLSRPPWSDEEKETLRRLIAAKVSPAAIVRRNLLPGRNRNAIRKQISRMKLADPVRSKRVRSGLKLDGSVRRQLEIFLRAEYRNHPPEQLTLIWNERSGVKLDVRRIRRELVSLGIKLPRSAILAMPYSVAKRKGRSRDQEKAQRARWKRYRKEKRAALLAAADEWRRENPGASRERCDECGTLWPPLPQFFPTTSKMTRVGRRFYRSSSCVLCTCARRRAESRARKRRAARR